MHSLSKTKCKIINEGHYHHTVFFTVDLLQDLPLLTFSKCLLCGNLANVVIVPMVILEIVFNAEKTRFYNKFEISTIQ